MAGNKLYLRFPLNFISHEATLDASNESHTNNLFELYFSRSE